MAIFTVSGYPVQGARRIPAGCSQPAAPPHRPRALALALDEDAADVFGERAEDGVTSNPGGFLHC